MFFYFFVIDHLSALWYINITEGDVMHKDILANLIIKKIISVSTMYSDPNAKGKRDNRSHWAIIIKFEGETIYNSNNEKYVSNKNNIIVLPKSSNYEWNCTQSGRFSIIEFDSDISVNKIFSFNVKDGEKFLKIFKELEYKRNLKEPTYKMECIHGCYSVLLGLIQSTNKNYQPDYKFQKIAPALDYIAKNYTKNIANDKLAEVSGFSTVHFRKLFTDVMGISPISYIHQLRIKKAKEMLKSDYGNITDIAYSLGYLSIYDFSRTFKKYAGLPPSKY